MAYQKRRSAAVEKAHGRLRGLQTTLPQMDLGNGLTLQRYAELIELAAQRLQTHNVALSEADRTRIEFAEIEASVSALSSRILSAVAAMYGRDSKEYEMAGGKPPSTYRRAKKPSSITGVSETQPGFSNTAPSNASTSNGYVMNGASTAP